MFKKTMKFDDLDGNEVEQTFYFNYNKKEIAELLEFKQLEEKLKMLQTPVEESGLSQLENNKMAYDIFQELVLDAYGEKGPDNVTFVKNERTRAYWKSHVAFVELIFEFLENPRLAAEFFEKCLPAKEVARVKAELSAKNEGKLSSDTLAEMVQEAERRQNDPATRIEPESNEPIPVAPVEEKPEVVVTDGLTDEEILSKKPQELSKPQLLRAMELKNRG